jgi:uncharacterized protein YbjT (DUF2867 family)
MILVTGAAGKTGQAIIRALSAKGRSVRALVYRPEQVPSVEALGAQDVAVGNMRVPAAMEQAAQGVRAVYHICPNMSPDEVTIGRVAIAATRAAGVEHFVYHSVLHPQTEKMPHHWLKLRVEEMLFESGLAYTILQPAAYMQNVLAHWNQIVERGVYPVPYAVETRLGMVDLEDVAAAAAKVLTESAHAGAIYELAGPEVLSQTEIAGVLSREFGRLVRAQTVSLEAWERGARAAGLSDYQIGTLLKMFRYYEGHGFWGNPRVLGWLLGHSPTTFAAFVKRTARQ